MTIRHPLPVGTQIRVRGGGCDEGIMSWDDTDTMIEREAPPGSICIVTSAGRPNPSTGDRGWVYDVEFIPSEVWNVLDEADFREMGDALEIVALGDGTMPQFIHDHYENPVRDPEAVRKIAEARKAENGGDMNTPAPR
jgi:hypothetical protein